MTQPPGTQNDTYETQKEPTTYIFEGTITDQDYDGDFQASVYSCSVCAALIRDLGQEKHTNYHQSVQP